MNCSRFCACAIDRCAFSCALCRFSQLSRPWYYIVLSHYCGVLWHSGTRIGNMFKIMKLAFSCALCRFSQLCRPWYYICFRTTAVHCNTVAQESENVFKIRNIFFSQRSVRIFLRSLSFQSAEQAVVLHSAFALLRCTVTQWHKNRKCVQNQEHSVIPIFFCV